MEDAAALVQGVYAPEPARRPWRLEDLLGSGKLRYFSFGRLALAEALQLAGVRPRDRVLLPGFI